MKKDFKKTLAVLSTSFFIAQAAMAGQPYVFGTINDINIPKSLGGEVIASVKSDETKLTIEENEVYLIPTKNLEFNSKTFNTINEEGQPKVLCKVLNRSGSKVERYLNRLDKIEERIEDAEDQDDWETADKLTERHEKTQELLDKALADQAKYAKIPAMNISGTWEDGFEDAMAKLKDANPNKPNLAIKRVPTRIHQLIHTGKGGQGISPFKYMSLNGQEYKPGEESKGSELVFNTKDLSESFVENEDGTESISLRVANEISSKTVAQNESKDPGTGGVFEAVATLGASCDYIAGAEENDLKSGGFEFQVIRSYPSIQYIAAKVKYSAEKLYSYFEKTEKGPADGWNAFKQEVKKEINEETNESEKFSFTYLCDEYYPGEAADCETKRTELEDKMKDVLVTQAAKAFAEFEFQPKNTQAAPLPENGIGGAIGAAASLYYGPEVGAVVTGLVDAFSSASSEIQVNQKYTKMVEETWTSMTFTPVYSSQAATVNLAK